MAPTTLPTPLGERAAVDVRAIERELADLWRQAHEGDNAVTRVCVLNLVVGVATSRAADDVTRVVSQLTLRHPNRAIVITADSDAATPALEAWVQAHCQVPGPGRQQVCCEQISVYATGAAVARVPGIVLPLLVPDVPVALWWPHGAPFGLPHFPKLAAMADRVILDSATFNDPESALAEIAALLDERHAVSDLAWGRLTSWRELTAQFFDAPMAAQSLTEITRVRLVYSQRTGARENRIPALLFVGWLAARLGWRRTGTATRHTATTVLRLHASDGHEVLVEMRPTTIERESPGRFVGLKLECPDASFTLSRDSMPDWVTAETVLGGRAPVRRGVRVDLRSDEERLSDELQTLGHDWGYEEALHFAMQALEWRG